MRMLKFLRGTGGWSIAVFLASFIVAMAPAGAAELSQQPVYAASVSFPSDDIANGPPVLLSVEGQSAQPD